MSRTLYWIAYCEFHGSPAETLFPRRQTAAAAIDDAEAWLNTLPEDEYGYAEAWAEEVAVVENYDGEPENEVFTGNREWVKRML